MHDCSDHVHNHFDLASLNKENMNLKLDNLDKFKGFDDFVYFSYKYWPLIKSDNLIIEKLRALFVEAAKKFKKFRNLDDDKLKLEADKFINHLEETGKLLFDVGDVHNATVKISQFVKPFTIEDKFIRNFNKKLDSAEI